MRAERKTDGQTDMTNLTGAFLGYENAPKYSCFCPLLPSRLYSHYVG
jgi:hypothetical protein